MQFITFTEITTNDHPLYKNIRKYIKVRLLIQLIFLSLVIHSCEPVVHGTRWDEDILTIVEYIETNPDEYSKFYKLLDVGNLLGTIGAYNPHSDGYTLFLPTNEAIDHFILESQDFGSFEELLLDTNFIHTFVRYQAIGEKIHSDEFPYGALAERTISGDRLVFNYSSDGDNLLIKINYKAPIIKMNLEMTNGYIHVISEVLKVKEISGYDWLQQQEEYSLLAEAMELSGIQEKLWLDKYTIFVEHDSIYHRLGIYNVDDLFKRVVGSGRTYKERVSYFYQFIAFHIVRRDFYLNDFYWEEYEYNTMSTNPLTISGGDDIRINPGVDTYGIMISEEGEPVPIDYLRPVLEGSNIMTHTGPIHSLSEVLVLDPIQD
jgi:uncharacterized surface protein with fasciclin (FAS1) repeats